MNCPNCQSTILHKGTVAYYCVNCGFMDPRIKEEGNMSNNEDLSNGAVIAAVLVAGLLLIVLLVGGCAGAKSYSRYQKRADANNNVKVTAINIRKAQQQARIVRAQNAAVRAKADQRYIEATGIRRAQDEISKTLTPLYVQHEAIKAMAESGAEKVFIPSGNQGVPLVNNVGGK